MKKFTLFAAAAMLVTGSASAAIIPVFSGSPTPDLLNPGEFTFTYEVQVQSGQGEILSPTVPGVGGAPAGGFDNHFTFFDFQGFTGNMSCVGPFCGSLTFSAPATGPSAYLQVPPDSAAFVNPTFTFSNGSAFPSGTSSIITLNSQFSGTQTILFSGQAAKSGGDLAGTVIGNSINTLGPQRVPDDPTVPEPATFLLMGAGIGAIVIARNRLKA